MNSAATLQSIFGQVRLLTVERLENVPPDSFLTISFENVLIIFEKVEPTCFDKNKKDNFLFSYILLKMN